MFLLLHPSTAIAKNWCEDANTVACYTFDDESGGATDLTTNDNDCTTTGTLSYITTESDCHSGECYGNNVAGNNYLACGNDSSIDLAETMSVCAWVYIDATGSEQYFIGKGSSGDGTASENDQYSFAIYGTTALKIFWESGTGTNHSVLSTATTGVSVETWEHYCMVRTTAATSAVDFYHDSAKIGNTVSGVTNVNDGSLSNLVLLALRTDGVADLVGRLDEVIITDDILSVADISDIYTNGLVQTIGTTATELRGLTLRGVTVR